MIVIRKGDSMYYIDKPYYTKIEIDHSVFHSLITPVKNVNEAKAFLEQVKKDYPKATHYIFIYIIGSQGELSHTTDDGEPSGTAGTPAIEVFRKQELTNFACCIVRYFGGVLLGASGLTRTYRKCVSDLFVTMNKIPLIEYSNMKLIFNYSFLDILTSYLKDYVILQKEFSDKVSFIIKVPSIELENVVAQLVNKTSNMISIQIIEAPKEEEELIIQEDKKAEWYER